MNAKLQKALDEELARHETVIGILAQTRLRDFLTKNWDNTPLQLKFGMGSCYVEVEGQAAHAEDYPALDKTLSDVEDITDYYRRACPTDIKVGA